MRANGELQKDVQEAIIWEPLLHTAEIGVIAKDGVITLTGTVDSYSKKVEAENAARSIVGVKAIIEKIEVRLGDIRTSDEDIIRDILKAYKWSLDIPNKKIKVSAEGGWITLSGEVERNSQRERAKTIVHNTNGVRGITNDLVVNSKNEDSLEKNEVEEAIVRNWSLHDAGVKVGVVGNKVTLSGTVHSLYQKDEAAKIAWNSAGVWNVDNDLVID